MQTHNQVSLNQLNGLLNQLKKVTNNLTKKRNAMKRGPGRPRKVSTHSTKTRMCKKCGCTNCGCGRNKRTKTVLIHRNPSSGKLVSRVINKNSMNKNTSVTNKTRKNVRSIINKLLSRTNHTRRSNLASMIEKIHTKENSQRNKHSQHAHRAKHLKPKRPSKCSRISVKPKHSIPKSVTHHNQPIVRSHSKTVKSYYTSSNNGSHKVEKGRRIEDDSYNPFIKVNTLNNGVMKSFQVSRH